ncbi:MAG: YIP1 family protein [Bryobacteraceae bacterium]|nr:YIP1 family protein [Bryobacteraceae bacterium]
MQRHPLRGLITIFFSPAETFVRAERRPGLIPLIASMLLALALHVMIVEVTGPGGSTLDRIARPAAGVPLTVCVLACVAYGLLRATGGVTTFAAVLGAFAWSTYVVMVVTFIGSAIYLTVVKDFSGVQPHDMQMLNASIFFDRVTTPGWLRSVAASVDLVTYWSLFLQVTGLRRLSAQVSMVQAASVVIILYFVGVLIRAAAAMMVG